MTAPTNKPMKTLATLAITTAFLALATGCGQQNQDQSPAASAPKAPTTAATEDVKSAVGAVQDQAAAAKQAASDAATGLKDQAAALKDAASKAATDLKDQAAAVKDNVIEGADQSQTALTSKAQSMLDNARKLIAEKDWAGALKRLGEAGNLKLTPEQQATLASLKEQAQKLVQEANSSKVADQAGKAVGDLLKK